jgi:flagellar protein FlaI
VCGEGAVNESDRWGEGQVTAVLRTAPRIVGSYDDGPSPTDPCADSAPGRHPVPINERFVETRPCFASSWIVRAEDLNCPVQSARTVSGVRVSLCAPPDASYGLYAVSPPEYDLNPASLRALSDAMKSILSDVPDGIELRSVETLRPHVLARAKDLLYAHLASRTSDDGAGHDIERESERLAELMCKYTSGYGVLETVLRDPWVQDIYVDSPCWDNPVQVVLRSDTGIPVRQKCRTNLYLGSRDVQAFVARIKFETGLPFSEAHPVLEADMRHLGGRVTLVGPPLSARGVSVAIRKHSTSVWTLTRLIANGTVSPLLASFLWACVIGRRTLLLAGSRGAGKTTLLTSLLLEFPLSQRIVLLEDTPEVPTARLQALGYDIQALRFMGGSAGSALSAQEALRVSLRMGESAIVVGEVRGEEAKVLYESMRAGSAGSSVLGTIHANSAKGVLDRAVEDLGVSERAFSSTDIVVVIGLIRSPDGTRFQRRVVEVVEVRQAKEGLELVPLFAIQPGCNCAKPTSEFSDECRAMTGISEALGVSPSHMLSVIRTRAHADQILAETEIAPGREWDEARVRSNEILSARLFNGDPEAGVKEWKEWVDASSAE